MNKDIEWHIFCQNIRQLRAHYGLSKTRMAGLLGVSIKTISSLEQGIVPPRMSSVVLYNIHVHFHILPHKMFTPLEL